jgi:hypothetical protein
LAPARLTDREVQQLGLREELIRRVVASGADGPVEIAEEVRPLRTRLKGAREGDLGALRLLAEEKAPALVRELFDLLEAEECDMPSAVLASDTSLHGLMAPRIRVRDYRNLTIDQQLLLVKASLHQARRALHEARWDAAADLATRCLEDSKSSSAVLWEARNVAAVAQWAFGLAADAHQTLSRRPRPSADAPEPVRVNEAILLGQTAQWHRAREVLEGLASEAMDPSVRISAAATALQASRRPLPHSVMQDLRRILPRDDIPLTAFRQVIELLARWDAEWLTKRTRLTPSPHKKTLEAQLWLAYARDFHRFCLRLRDALLAGDVPKWVIAVKDDLVAELLADGLASKYRAMTVLSSEVPMKAAQAAQLRRRCLAST